MAKRAAYVKLNWEIPLSINVVRVLVGGVIIGATRLIVGGFVRRIVVMPLFGQEMRENHPSLISSVETTSGKISMVMIMMLIGIVTMYTYAAMRPQFATRLATVFSAAFAMWFLASLNWAVTAVMGLFSWRHIIVECLLTFGTVLVATYLGSRVYPEADDSHPARAPSLSPAATIAP